MLRKMKLSRNIAPAAAALLLTAAGCNSTPVRQEERAMEPPTQAQQAVVERRAAALRRVLAPLKVRGAGVPLSSYRHRLLPGAEIMKILRQLGFNRLYCYISSETELDDELRGLLGSASKEGIPVELMVRQGDFRHRFRGNALVRSFLPQFRKLPDLAAEIVKFNETLPPSARLAGVTVRFEPHLFTRANGADRIPGMIWIWSDMTFGKGLDNDKLVESSIEVFKEMKAKLNGLPLTVELPDFYPVWYAGGSLSWGRVPDFAAFDGVMIQCSGNVPSALVRGYAAGSGGRPLVALIPLADHSSVSRGALRRRDWNDFVRAMDYFVRNAAKQRCPGVVLMPLFELGFMLLEQD